MGFREARSSLIQALRSGSYEHEARDVRAEKNLLAVGDVSADFVIDMLRAASGDGYSAAPHHWDPAIAVHIFRCHDGNVRWYVKAYFLQPNAVFISVHPSS